LDYLIPVVQVEKAGISSTGSKIENELIAVAEEFNAYRKQNELWQGKRKSYTYPIIDDEITRSNGVNEPEVFYGKSE
jgi:type I restriction enzyme M protein